MGALRHCRELRQPGRDKMIPDIVCILLMGLGAALLLWLLRRAPPAA